MGSRAVLQGPVAQTVAVNVRAIRVRRGLSQAQLAEALGRLGRPMQTTGIAKIESGDRRVDVDDLVALAITLNVSLGRLLLPDVEQDAAVAVAPARSVPLWAAWQWVLGQHSLADEDDDLLAPDVQDRELGFAQERPGWMRLREDQELQRATRAAQWTVTRALDCVDRAQSGAPAWAAAERWLRHVEEAAKTVTAAARRLRTEAHLNLHGDDRG